MSAEISIDVEKTREEIPGRIEAIQNSSEASKYPEIVKNGLEAANGMIKGGNLESLAPEVLEEISDILAEVEAVLGIEINNSPTRIRIFRMRGDCGIPV